MSISPEQVTELVDGVVTDQGFDLEDVVVRSRGDRDEVSVVVDRDGGSPLDVLAALSQQIEVVLDADPRFADDAYTLEVTSPGVDRPLTQPRHWRRARGRKVALDLNADAAEGHSRRRTGRIGRVDEDSVDIVVNNRGRFTTETVRLADIDNAVVQVDFSRPGATELELCGLSPAEIEARRTDQGV